MLLRIPTPTDPQVPGNARASLTCAGSVTFQQGMDMPVSYDLTFARTMGVDGEPEAYKPTLTEVKTPLQPRELSAVGYVVIHNREGEGLQTMPTEEERKAIKEAMIEIYFGQEEGRPPDLFVLPGEKQLLQLANWKSVFLCCRKGKAKASILLFPPPKE